MNSSTIVGFVSILLLIFIEYKIVSNVIEAHCLAQSDFLIKVKEIQSVERFYTISLFEKSGMVGYNRRIDTE